MAAAGALADGAETRPQPYRFAPPDAWVNVARDVPLDGAPVEEGESDYLLVDNQVRLSKITSHYFRSIERLTSQDAVDRSAQISISIDPEHELVLLHEVRVLRGNRAIDKLADSRRSLLNREQDLEVGLLNGRVTLHLLLQDVRVGDVLDFSYTRERRDPFGERGYNDWFNTQWGSPVRQLRVRILSPQDRPLTIRDHGRLAEPMRMHRGAWIETQWMGKDIPALPGEDSRPRWHYYYPRIEVSEFADWQAVRTWAKPLYAVSRRGDAALKALIADVASEPDPRARLLKALRFVQDDIRYTGLEIGAGAYRPTQPVEVLARRFGDCKDKTLLLITVLRELGIEAWPALVHSGAGDGLIERAPGPGAFDHVIAKVRLGDSDYWVDATNSGQGGDLETLAQADFGPALVIDDSRNGLERMPRRDAPEPNYHVLESYDLRQGREKPAKFTVRTQYRREEADAVRVKMRGQTASALGKQYLDYYRKTYSGIRMAAPLKAQDDRAANVYTVTESYEIDNPFEKRGGAWKFFMEAYLVTDKAKSPPAGERTTPLARSFPMHVRHEIVAQLAGEWDIDSDIQRINDPAFEYVSQAKFRDGKLRLVYDLRNTADHVPAQRLEEYRKNIRRVYDDAFFTLTDDDEKAKATAASSSGSGGPSGPSWLMLGALPVGLLGSAFSVRWLARRRWRRPPAVDGAPAGIAGWLLLPAGLAMLLPLFALGAIGVLLNDYGSAAGYAGLDWIQKVLRLLQMCVLCEMLLVGSTSIWALWRRSALFPLLVHSLMAEIAVLAVFDIMLQWRSGEFLLSDLDPLMGPTAALALAATISAYTWRSQRVRATFAPALSPEAAAAAPVSEPSLLPEQRV